MSLNNKPYPGLISEEAKRLKNLNDLLQSLNGRHDMLTLDEQKDLKSIIVKMQAAQGVSMLESR